VFLLRSNPNWIRLDRRRRWLGLLLTALFGPLLAEGLLRWMVFSDQAFAERVGARFRRPELFVASPFSDDYNKLSWLLQSREVRARPVLYADPEIGWLRAEVSADGRHAEEVEVGARRPVLLFGSSFARCKRVDEPCFEGLLDSSELGSRLKLLNFAVQGYGLDQILLLLRRSLRPHAAQGPLVVIAFVVEADLERSTISFFSRPKPRFVRGGDLFVLQCPDRLEPGEFLARHPPAITSYFWRYLLNRSGIALATRQAWEGEDERCRARDGLTEFLLAELARACAGTEHFVLLFHMKRAQRAEPSAEERALHERLARAGLAWVDTRATAATALARDGRTLEELYDPWDGHPTELGTRIFFEALVRGLRGERDGG
jgi:hypothetical protein